MRIHILGICGTFMGSLAILAAKAGMQVSGQDAKVYPPMSTQLVEQGIAITDGYELADLPNDADIYVIGNVMRRGMPIVEHIMNKRLRFMSGPAFLAEYILRDQHVLVVTGTHGKTTTTSLLTWILHYAGLNPGYLIGGVPNNFGVSADLGAGKYFVVEGDEYNCAFFDRNSKFLHYKAQTLILNNIEFDHADIFKDLDAILTQFNYLLRTIAGDSLIIYREDDQNIQRLFEMGCWSRKEAFSKTAAPFALPNTLLGEHNRLNALAAIAAAKNVGVPHEVALMAVQEFAGVKRRLELKGQVGEVTVYSDFAHHPTAIDVTLAAIRAVNKDRRIVAVVDICTNTMRGGTHKDTLGAAVNVADIVYFFHGPDVKWDVNKAWQDSNKPGGVYSDHANLLTAMLPQIRANDLVLLMSNGSFENFAQTLLNELSKVKAEI